MPSMQPLAQDGDSVQFVLAATGARCAALAVECVSSLRAVEPEVPVLIATDGSNLDDLTQSLASHTNLEVVALGNSELNWNDKLQSLTMTTASNVILMDVDLVLIRPIVGELMASLRYCDVLVRGGMSFNLPWERSFGGAIPQYNTGLVALGPNAMSTIPQRWIELRRQRPQSHDQPTFRAALLESGLRVGSLSQDFNFMSSDYVIDRVAAVHFAGWFGVLTSAKRKRSRVLRNCAKARPGDLLIYGELCFRDYPRPVGLIRVLLMTAPRFAGRTLRDLLRTKRARIFRCFPRSRSRSDE